MKKADFKTGEVISILYNDHNIRSIFLIVDVYERIGDKRKILCCLTDKGAIIKINPRMFSIYGINSDCLNNEGELI